MGAKIRHIAFNVPDPEAAAKFYIDTFGLEKVGETHNPTADGIYLSDGTINLALIRYKMDEPLGPGRTKDDFGVHHIGFWVDDAKQAAKNAAAAGGKWLTGEIKEGTGAFYEMKYTDPNGNVIDITHNGWVGAKKD
jgi:catechol 2,3-dioxygenase-like lactoylglutathione lyase family enzyme